MISSFAGPLEIAIKKKMHVYFSSVFDETEMIKKAAERRFVIKIG